MLPLLAAAAPIVGGLLGGLLNNGDEDAANAARQRALQQIMDLPIPDIEKQKIVLNHLQSQGQLSPTLEGTESLQDSGMNSIQSDPRLRDAQMNALAQMQGLSTTGMNADDRMVLNKMRNDVAAQAQGRDQGILQQMEQRGMGGSGNELAARMMASQAATQQAQTAADSQASMAQQRALQAMAQAGTLGGQVRGQDFDQAAAKAQAQDEINKFNTTNRQSVQSRNVAARNQAAETNLSNAQRIADSNVGFDNQAEINNKGLVQQNYENELAKRKAAAGMLGDEAAAKQKSADQTSAMWGGIGQGVGQMGMAYATKKKEDEQPPVYGPPKPKGY
jgi:hypothetical protein